MIKLELWFEEKLSYSIFIKMLPTQRKKLAVFAYIEKRIYARSSHLLTLKKNYDLQEFFLK